MLQYQSLLLVFRWATPRQAAPSLRVIQNNPRWSDLPATVLIWELEETWCFVLEMAERISFHLEKLYVRNETHWVTGCGLSVCRAEDSVGQTSISSSREHEACLGNFRRFYLKSLRANEGEGCSSVGKCLPSMGKSQPSLLHHWYKNQRKGLSYWCRWRKTIIKSHVRSQTVCWSFDIVCDCTIVVVQDLLKN